MSYRLRFLQTDGLLLKHLAARGSSKRLVNAGYMRLSESLANGVRTVRRADLIVLNKSVVYKRLDDLLY